jgi:hypothetical protein
MNENEALRKENRKMKRALRLIAKADEYFAGGMIAKRVLKSIEKQEKTSEEVK